MILSSGTNNGRWGCADRMQRRGHCSPMSTWRRGYRLRTRCARSGPNEVLAALDTEFEALYEGIGRRSVAPERLLRASLLQAFYSVRSERQLMEQINYNLLFRWFGGLGIDDAVWDHSTFSKNRERLLGADVAAKFLAAVLRHPKVTRFLSDEHFSVDGTLGLAQEFPRQGRFRRATRARAQRRAA